MAEIQHFYDPKVSIDVEKLFSDKDLDTCLPIFSAEDQMSGRSISALTVRNIISTVSPLVVFYLLKTFNFIISIGVDQSKVRFRQHMDHEMAHYAKGRYNLFGINFQTHISKMKEKR